MDTGAEEMDVEDLNEYVRRRLRVYLGCAMTCVDSELSEQASILSATSDLFAEFGFEVYNPSLVTEPGSFHDCREVYAIDHVQAVSSDLIFMIRVQSSLGMGIEAQITADMLIPWGEVKFKGEASKLSPILSGLPTRGIGFQVHLDRASPSDYRDHLRAMLKNMICAIKLSRHRELVSTPYPSCASEYRLHNSSAATPASNACGRACGKNGNPRMVAEAYRRTRCYCGGNFAGAVVPDCAKFETPIRKPGQRISETGLGNPLAC